MLFTLNGIKYSCNCIKYSCIEKYKIKKKRQGMAQFKKYNLTSINQFSKFF